MLNVLRTWFLVWKFVEHMDTELARGYVSLEDRELLMQGHQTPNNSVGNKMLPT